MSLLVILVIALGYGNYLAPGCALLSETEQVSEAASSDSNISVRASHWVLQ